MARTVLVDQLGDVAVLTVNRPAARNALDGETGAALLTALHELDASADTRVMVITGAGGTFSAGMDLKAFAGGQDMRPLMQLFAELCTSPPRTPLIAAVEGWAVAGGCELALGCDLIVAAEDARFGLPEVRRGLVAGGGGLLALPRRLPVGVATQLALTGDDLSAVDAHRFGLVSELHPPGTALEGALVLARRIAANGPLAVAVTKEVLRRAQECSLAEGFAMQGPLLAPVFASDDAREGATAFAERRPALWSGH